MLKKALAIFLIALQCLGPATAGEGFAEALKALALRSLSQSLATGMDVASLDPKAVRAMDAAMLQRSRLASELFAVESPPAVDTYNPGNPIASRQHIERWRAFAAGTATKQVLTNEELTEAAAALLPFLRYYVWGDARKPDHAGSQVLVPGGNTVQFALQGYCMDRAVPAPAVGEKLQLIPIQKLLPEELVPLYQVMMQYAALHAEKRTEIQNLVWGLRHAGDRYPPIRALDARQTALLDAIAPNGATLYRLLLALEAERAKEREARKQLFRAVLGAAQSQLNVRLPDPTASGYSTSDTQSLLDALTRMPVEGVAQDNSEFTLLAPGVAAKVVANGLSEIRVQVTNHTGNAIAFNPIEFAGQSTRVTQRVGFGALLGRVAGDSKNFLERLHDILQLLELPALKKLQAQIQATIDAQTELAGISDLSLAGLALATAINEVLLPTTVLDVAGLKSGALVGVVERLGYKEVLALEKAAEAARTAAKSPIDYAHIIGGDFTKAGKASGGHSLLNGDVRVVPGTESLPDARGVYTATVQVADPKNPGQWITKTSNGSENGMFPTTWDAPRIKMEVDAAWNDRTKTISSNGQWMSTTPSGVRVEGWTSPRITAYPIYEP